MKKKTTSFTSLSKKLIACFFCIFSINSFAAEILDQTFTLPGSATTINGTGSGQSFTAGYTGPLTKIIINIKDQSPTASSSDIRIRIIDGAGSCGTTILADETFLNITEFQNYSFNLSTPPNLTIGQTYTILLSTTDGSLCNIAFGSGAYANGDFYSGITCTPFGGGTDFWFETYMNVCLITDQTVSTSQTTLCNSGAVSISTGSSETGFNYYLRDDADSSIVDGPVAGTGNAINFNTGTINSTTTYNVYAKEPKISAVDLANNDDFIRFNAPFTAYTNEITVEAWVQFNISNFVRAGQSSAGVDNMATNVWLWEGGSFFVNNSGTWISLQFPTITTTGWMHVATVANSSGMFIYYDGVLVASNSIGITMGILNNTNSVMELGHDPRFTPSVRNNNAVYDNFRVWNVARSASEIADNYKTCLSGSETGLAQYTLMNEATGTALNSLQGDNGIITNGIANPWVLGSGVCDDACELEMSQTITVTVNNSTTGSQTFVECAGFSVTVGTNTYNATGIYTDVLTGSNGCDSTVTTDLTIKQPTTGSQTFVECAGFSVTVGTNTYNATGIYTDVFTGSNGCDSTVTTDLTVEPAINVTVDNTLTPTLSANQTGATYQWLDCNNGNAVIPSETGQTFTATVNGNYAVEITVGSCVDTSACENITGVGINETANNVVSIYPNPTNGMVNINFGGNNSTVNYSISSIEGKVVETGKTSTNNITVDLSTESKGVYFIRINTESTSSVYKLVRQ